MDRKRINLFITAKCVEKKKIFKWAPKNVGINWMVCQPVGTLLLFDSASFSRPRVLKDRSDEKMGPEFLICSPQRLNYKAEIVFGPFSLEGTYDPQL